MNLEGRVVVITGGASGIGQALAHRFAAEPVRAVVVADLDEDRAAAVAGTLSVEAVGAACDVTERGQNEALIGRVEDLFGTVDIFCANAGVALGTRLESDEAEFRRVMDVNLMGHVSAARRLLPSWLARGEGYFISTASAAGLLSQIGDVAYSVSKHAAVAFAEWLAITYGSRGLRVSCLCPMGVDTPLGGFGSEPEETWSLAARSVMAAGPILAPEDVAEQVIAAVGDERFFILPHPEVADFQRRKADDHDRWLAGMRRLQNRVGAPGQPGSATGV